MKSTRRTAVLAMRTLTNAGFDAFLVGGCVRDKVMGAEPKDFDVTTNATPDQVQEIFAHTIPVGASFGVVRVLVTDESFEAPEEIEIATFRADGDYSDGRRPDTVKFSETVNEDVIRRDFTINGLLEAPNGDVLDLVGGLQDIQNKKIRAIGDPQKRFQEDSLRMLRAVRFAARFDFTIEVETMACIIANAGTIKRVSQERITDEILKMLGGPRPGVALRLLGETTLLFEIFPELSTSRNPFGFFPDEVVVPKVLKINIVLHKLTGCGMVDPIVGLVLLLSELRDKEFFQVLERMKLSAIQKQIATTAFTFNGFGSGPRMFTRLREFGDADLSVLKRFLRLPGNVEAQEVFYIESRHGIDKFNANPVLERLANIKPEAICPTPLLNGNDLIAMGLKPGPIFTDLLHVVETSQLNEAIKTKEQAMNVVKTLMAVASNQMQVRQE